MPVFIIGGGHIPESSSLSPCVIATGLDDFPSICLDDSGKEEPGVACWVVGVCVCVGGWWFLFCFPGLCVFPEETTNQQTNFRIVRCVWEHLKWLNGTSPKGVQGTGHCDQGHVTLHGTSRFCIEAPYIKQELAESRTACLNYRLYFPRPLTEIIRSESSQTHAAD